MKNKTSTSNYTYKKFDINDCYEDFKSNSNHFSLSYADYKNIVKTFLTIYFYELYFFKFPIYFLFGGKICKNKISESVKISKLKRQNNALISIKNNVGLFWYDRPFKKFEQFALKKLCGKTGSLQKIQREWLSENDPSFLPTVEELKNKLK